MNASKYTVLFRRESKHHTAKEVTKDVEVTEQKQHNTATVPSRKWLKHDPLQWSDKNWVWAETVSLIATGQLQITRQKLL